MAYKKTKQNEFRMLMIYMSTYLPTFLYIRNAPLFFLGCRDAMQRKGE